MTLKILAISGSLRKKSYNSALLKACQLLAPDSTEIILFDGLADIPPFNPDIEASSVESVLKLKQLLALSSGLIISSPEYAHGVSGVLKNALDWLVSEPEFVDKRVAIFNTSPRASHAINALHEIIRTMSGNIEIQACLTLPLLGSELSYEGILEDEHMVQQIREALDVFCSFG
ncbi:NADPH-dependent FMN reductase [Pseudoalteromonas xiamenensis]|uniref:NADPH-dependent FMN reductase n=1 Tax=Pseudoalteromonas xiamenensis TaxID=882626 RepID=UPI001FCB663C|nr:NADPH-dependent FMN reductase [Pseudoalteromonas xiamenensis]